MTGPSTERVVRLSPEPASVSAARRVVRERLGAAGLEQLTDDAALAASELVANAVLHARTEIALRVATSPTGVRISVEDRNRQLPSPAPMGPTASSGRGLALLQALAEDWGVQVLPGGKVVWFALSTAARPEAADLSPEALLGLWADTAPPPASPAPTAVRVVLPDMPVQRMVAAKRRVEDLVRDLRLVLIGRSCSTTDGGPADDELALARRLDAAAADFDAGRVQLRTQAIAAAARGLDRATLEVLLPVEALSAAQRYRAALDEADELSRSSRLLLAGGLAEHADLRRSYLDAIVTQLQAALTTR